MNNFIYFLGLVFLILVQVVIVPLNFAFAAIFGASIFNEKSSLISWLILLSILFALVSNQNLGLVLAVFASSFLTLEFLSKILPRNNVVKWGLIGGSLLVCEFSFVVFVNLLK